MSWAGTGSSPDGGCFSSGTSALLGDGAGTWGEERRGESSDWCEHTPTQSICVSVSPAALLLPPAPLARGGETRATSEADSSLEEMGLLQQKGSALFPPGNRSPCPAFSCPAQSDVSREDTREPSWPTKSSKGADGKARAGCSGPHPTGQGPSPGTEIPWQPGPPSQGQPFSDKMRCWLAPAPPQALQPL